MNSRTTSSVGSSSRRRAKRRTRESLAWSCPASRASRSYAKPGTAPAEEKADKTLVPAKQEKEETTPPRPDKLQRTLGMNLSYTINLNLPATSDVAVFNAIFKSLKENLLQDSDG